MKITTKNQIIRMFFESHHSIKHIAGIFKVPYSDVGSIITLYKKRMDIR
jgi:hypothetical protein